ncbi:MAG TPA: tRNA (adenosine(37)-N6)-threonylcarbamoyltransferase complex dimerization subunit type 1 TsaB [Longimicrobiales bacterium]
MLLAIETSTDYGSIAIGRGADLAGEVVIGARTRHGEMLLPALDFLLRTTGTRRNLIRGVVVGAGPGSFTGVRVAAATARGLAAGLDVPLRAYSSLMALAVEAAAAGPVCVLFDARRGEVYAACYERDGSSDRMVCLVEPDAVQVHDLRARTARMSVAYTGDGARRYADALGIVPPPPAYPRAAALLRLAAADPDGGRIEDVRGWEPTYLRASGAERGIAG